MVRLMGTEHPDALADTGEAGWKTDNVAAHSASAHNGGAYGLFIIPSASAYTNVTGALAAVVYLDEGSLKLKGNKPGGVTAESGSSLLIANSGADFEFTMQIASGSSEETVVASEYCTCAQNLSYEEMLKIVIQFIEQFK